MAAIQQKELSQVLKLYNVDKLPASGIAKKYGVSLWSAYYFMRKNKIIRRTQAQDRIIRFENKVPSFRLKENLNDFDKELKTLGVVLYWGEGYKTENATGVDFANSDPALILSFLKFLREICGAEESKIKAFLYCYSNQNPISLVDFWSKLTRIPKSHFSKPYIRRDFRLEKSGKMIHGLLHIRYFDKKLLLQIKKWIEEYKQKYS